MNQNVHFSIFIFSFNFQVQIIAKTNPIEQQTKQSKYIFIESDKIPAWTAELLIPKKTRPKNSKMGVIKFPMAPDKSGSTSKATGNEKIKRRQKVEIHTYINFPTRGTACMQDCTVRSRNKFNLI